MARPCEMETPAEVEIHGEPRPPERDPTLGIPVTVERTNRPRHRLVTIGDSITQGFMSGAIFRTHLSWPAIVADELGFGARFRFPTYERSDGPGGLPLDLERLARFLDRTSGPTLTWNELMRTARRLRSYLDGIEDYWERGPGAKVPPTGPVFHNQAVYGWTLLDAMVLDADRLQARIGVTPPRDNVLDQLVEHHNDRAGLVVAQRARATDGTGQTVLGAAAALGEEGARGQPGIETLVVVLGANNVLGAAVRMNLCWSSADYLDLGVDERLAAAAGFTIFRPSHFAAEWADLVTAVRRIRARHVIVATVPAVTIPPVTRGVGTKVRPGSRYFPYYTRPWVTDDDFDPRRDAHLTEDQARTIDSAIDAYNTTIIESVRAARHDGLDWYVLDLGGVLDSLATRRYVTDPDARPPWWEPYPLPPELVALDPVPDTRFFRSGPQGRTEGGLFSLDGVHPTTIGYGIVAQEVIRVMARAGVAFTGPGRGGRVLPSPVTVDFARLVAADTLVSDPPTSVMSTLDLLGWLDQMLNWVHRVLPFGP
jgi:hypothetical protein